MSSLANIFLQLILILKWISFIYESGYKVLYPWNKEDETGVLCMVYSYANVYTYM